MPLLSEGQKQDLQGLLLEIERERDQKRGRALGKQYPFTEDHKFSLVAPNQPSIRIRTTDGDERDATFQIGMIVAVVWPEMLLSLQNDKQVIVSMDDVHIASDDEIPDPDEGDNSIELKAIEIAPDHQPPNVGRAAVDPGGERRPQIQVRINEPREMASRSPEETASPVSADGTKKCPFCAEDIKAEAIKCRFCGEMLNGGSVGTGGRGQPRVETKTFVIPFPPGSIPTHVVIERKGNGPSVSKEYIRQMAREAGSDDPELLKHNDSCGWHYALYLIWLAWGSYFLERINELGSEGWQLAEPFDSVFGAAGSGDAGIRQAMNRFELERRAIPGIFGNKEGFVAIGAKFVMRRTSF